MSTNDDVPPQDEPDDGVIGKQETPERAEESDHDSVRVTFAGGSRAFTSPLPQAFPTVVSDAARRTMEHLSRVVIPRIPAVV